jgi:hypothetical protein
VLTVTTDKALPAGTKITTFERKDRLCYNKYDGLYGFFSAFDVADISY